MIDINKLEESVLIEANVVNMGIRQLINDITVQYRHMGQAEIYKLACSVIGSLFMLNYASVVKTRYKREQKDLYVPICSAGLPEQELDVFLKNPEKWDEAGVFSKTEPIELHITEKGRDYLSTL
jgi:hypothetical protein